LFPPDRSEYPNIFPDSPDFPEYPEKYPETPDLYLTAVKKFDPFKMRSGLVPERRVGRDGDGECSLSALKDRSLVDLASDDVYRTNRPPCYGQGCGVRLVVDSTPPVGGSA
jgi:hypothetical protein